MRELREETGYEGKVGDAAVVVVSGPTLAVQPGLTDVRVKVLDCSPTIVADPGLTNANMQVGSVVLCYCLRVSNGGMYADLWIVVFPADGHGGSQSQRRRGETGATSR